jgi:murein endopeptidase
MHPSELQSARTQAKMRAVTGGLSIALAALALTSCEPTLGVYDPPIAWQASVAVGRPFSKGRLRRGVQLPADGPNHVTYDPGRRTLPNRPWRRWGTERTVRTTLCVVEDYRRAHPDAPRIVIGDLSRTNGGPFGPRFGGLGHASHQNGRDVDVYYPRWDGRETAPRSLGDVDLTAAQDLLDRFVAAGATLIVVGPDTGLRVSGYRVTLELARHHNDHMHVRLPAR